jgi:purine nucleosidase
MGRPTVPTGLPPVVLDSARKVVEGDGMPRKIIVDCDPGPDDAIALLLAQGSPEVELCAITTVMGNSTLADVSRHALAVAALGGIQDVPIAAGCARPLIGTPGSASLRGSFAVDGDLDDDFDGALGGLDLPLPTRALDSRHAVDVIIETVLGEAPGTVTLVPTAALTNIALAVRKEPRIAERVAEVVLMGGALAGGNRTAAAESNIATDPEAAYIVFEERWPVTMVGLDLTQQALAPSEVLERIAALGTAPARFFLEVLRFYGGTQTDGGGANSPVHDLCAVARVIDPAVMTTRRAPVTVELTGRHTRGMTIADLRGPASSECHTQVAVDLDNARFWDLVLDALKQIGAP